MIESPEAPQKLEAPEESKKIDAPETPQALDAPDNDGTFDMIVSIEDAVTLKKTRSMKDMKIDHFIDAEMSGRFKESACEDVISFLKTDVALIDLILSIDMTSKSDIESKIRSIVEFVNDAEQPKHQKIYLNSLNREEKDLEAEYNNVLSRLDSVISKRYPGLTDGSVFFERSGQPHGDLLPLREQLRALHAVVDHAPDGGAVVERHVMRVDHVGHVPEDVDVASCEVHVPAVVVEQVELVLDDIQGGSAEVPGLESGDEGFSIYDSTPRGVDKDGTLLHL